MNAITDLQSARALDDADPLAPMRDRFDLPDGVNYFDGNSLGPLLESVRDRLERAVDVEWGRDLIKSWNTHGWFELPQTVGAKLARLIGAQVGEVVATDGTTINLFKVAAASLRLRPDRRVIVTQEGNFPTDIYVLEGLVELLGHHHEIRLVSNDGIIESLSDDVAALILTQVDYRTGECLDMEAVTRAAQGEGILTIWDLSHSAGAVEVDLNGANADFAVGCGYKYLNGGPGAPAFLFVAERHQERARQPLSGWWGHEAPFDFDNRYRPAPGVARHLCGTQPILSLVALDAALDVFAEVRMSDIRRKSVALTESFIGLVERECRGFGFELASPRDAARRGSQVSFSHPDGYAIMQALIARNVIGDFRAPDMLRFGFAPLYVSFQDVWNATGHLREVMETGEWRKPAYQIRSAVT